MATIALDTLRISKRLREAGFSEPQAEVVTDVLHEAQDSVLSGVATKIDVNDLKTEMKTDNNALRIELASLRSQVIITHWMLGLVVAGVISLVLRSFVI